MRVHAARLFRVAIGGCLGLGFLQAEAAFSATFKVAPIQVTLSASRPSAILTLSNESDETLRFQISAFAWGAGSKGEIKLEPTKDVTFFPELLALEAGKERKVRVGVSAPAGAVERTYRIFFEELPPPETSKAPPAGTQVRVLTKMGIPIFLAPARPAASGALEGAELVSGALRFRVRNTGNVHFLLDGVTVKGVDAADGVVVEKRLEGWYVLAGGAREYELTLDAVDCARLSAVLLEAATDRGPFSTRVAVSPGACPTAAPSPPPAH